MCVPSHGYCEDTCPSSSINHNRCLSEISLLAPNLSVIKVICGISHSKSSMCAGTRQASREEISESEQYKLNKNPRLDDNFAVESRCAVNVEDKALKGA